MKIIKNLGSLNEDGHQFAVTIGNFDGVHVGHQTILKTILDDCRKDGLELVVVTFEPHPIQILKPRNHFLINSFTEKRELLRSVGIKYLCEIDFSRDVSTLTPGSFLDEYILSCKDVKRIYLGHDFAFGANKSGDHQFVREYCQPKNIDVKLLNEFTLKEKCVSSTKIREALSLGSVEEVSKMLNRNFFISGMVVKGEGRGRKIGFPTANIRFPAERIVPAKGVYITRTQLGDQVWDSLTNIGNNPTFNTGNDIFVETHILDFDGNIYGDEITVEFIKKIRDEKKFESVNHLVDQIKKDEVLTRDFFRGQR